MDSAPSRDCVHTDLLSPDRRALRLEGAEAAVGRQVETCPGARHPGMSVWDERVRAAVDPEGVLV